MSTTIDTYKEQQTRLNNALEVASKAFKVAFEYQSEACRHPSREAIERAQSNAKFALQASARVEALLAKAVA